MTVEDAGSHRTGMPRHGFSFISSNDSRTGKHMSRTIRHLQPSSERRVLWQYCNIIYITMTHALEVLTETPWWDTMTVLFLALLCIEDSCSDLAKANASGKPVAPEYVCDKDKKEYLAMLRKNLINTFGAGDIISTVDDYVKWVRFAMAGRHSPTPGSANTEVRNVRMPFPPSKKEVIPVSYTPSWENAIFHDRRMWHHRGTTTLHSVEAFWPPDLNWGFVGFANTDTANGR